MLCSVSVAFGEQFGVEHGAVAQDAPSQLRGHEGTGEETPGEFGLVDHGRDDVFGGANALVEGATV